MPVRGLWIIAKDSGISIFSRYYREQGIGDELFSGYMSALTSFLGELTASQGKLEKLINLGSQYSLSTEDLKLSIRGIDSLIFVLVFDKADNEEVMNKVLRRVVEVFRAMYGERITVNKKDLSSIDFRNFELVMDGLIETLSGGTTTEEHKKQKEKSEKPQLLPKDMVADLNFIKGINVTVDKSSQASFDEKVEPGFPVEAASRDRSVSVVILFKTFLDQNFFDWTKLLVDVIHKSGILPAVDRLRLALLYVDNCLTRNPKPTDKYTLQFMLYGSLTPYGIDEGIPNGSTVSAS
jgi:hypothetical protein